MAAGADRRAGGYHALGDTLSRARTWHCDQHLVALAVFRRARNQLQKKHLGQRPPVGVETVEVYPLGGRERPTAFWWHATPQKTWSMGCCARESGDAIRRSRLGN